VKGGHITIYRDLKVVNSEGFIKPIDFISRGQPIMLSTSDINLMENNIIEQEDRVFGGDEIFFDDRAS